MFAVFGISTVMPQQAVWINAEPASANLDDRYRLVNFVNTYDRAIRDGSGAKIALSDVEGSMYNVREFRKGQVYVGEELHATFPMRYNAYSDEFEVKKDVGDEVLGLTKSTTLTFVLGGQSFVYRNYLDKKEKSVQGYLQVLEEGGNYKLYYRKAKIFKEGKKAQTSFHPDIPHKFVDSETFYLAAESSNPRYISNSKKAMREMVAESEWLKVKDYMKNHKIDLSKKTDLLKLVRFMNINS